MQKASYRVAAVALLVTLAAAVSAFAAGTVRTRAANHAGFGRIVFDWPAPVTFQARVEGSSVIVHFDRPMSTNLMSVTQRLPGYVNSAHLAADHSTLIIRLARPATLESAEHDNLVV